MLTSWTLRAALGAALLTAIATVGVMPAAADDLGSDEIVVSGLKRETLAGKCRVKIQTQSDGKWKSAKVWNVEVDRRLYVLSSKSGWYKRLREAPNAILSVDQDDYPIRARLVEDEAERDRVHQALKEKCGCCYKMRSFFTFWRSNKVAKIVPRPPGH